MNVYCDDGSTTIKLAWNDNGKICKSLSQNSFRHGWKVDGLGIRQTFNYELDGKKYTYDEVSNQSILTTHIEYQYTDVNLLAVHHALLNSGLAPQPVSLTVTLPISEFYTKECQKNELNIQRKIENLMRPIRLNKGDVFTIEHVDVMPESLPAVFSRLVMDKVGQFEKSLVVDIGGTTLDVGVIVVDEIQLKLKLDGDTIADGAFVGDGCAISQASTDIMLGMIVGRSREEALRLGDLFLRMIRGEASEEEIDSLEEASALRDVSHMPARVKCAMLGWRTLRKALGEKTPS